MALIRIEPGQPVAVHSEYKYRLTRSHELLRFVYNTARCVVLLVKK